jgi:predicted NAD-dependent protein-ADP-ribosyltransferase YbiA (DUF1768 family)/hemin uptake protein HemP
MVLSRLNKSVSYSELKKINKGDMNKETELYEIEVNDIPIIIAVGNIQNNYQKDNNIVYFPIYFIKKNKKAVQIGVYEIYFNELQNYLDENKELDIDRLEPLIYGFVNDNFLEKNKIIEEELKEINEGIEEKDDLLYGVEEEEGRIILDEKIIPENRRSIFTINPETVIPNSLKEETEKQANDYVEKYNENKMDNWVQKFMKNKNYILQDNEGGGDCFFATIRDAFKSIGQETTVNKLRDRLSKEATETIFKNYKEQYDMFNSSIKNDNESLIQIKKEVEELKEKLKNVIDNYEKKEIVNRIKQLKGQYDRIKLEIGVSKENLNEFKFLKGIKNVNDFKKIIKTCNFWADIWAIITIERMLNIKIIILSSESYLNNDLLNIIQCGNNEDKQINSLGIFEPEYYIILDHTGSHYRLIGYKNTKIFKFKELPYYLKNMLVDKCMESNGGLFNLIPDFKRLKMIMKGEIIEGENVEGETNVKNDKIIFKEVAQSELRNLFNDDVVFLIYSKGSDRISPGKSSGEKIPRDRVRDFADLKGENNWRKKLDDNWISEFTLDKHRWSSVTNYMEGSKYKNENRDFYIQFSLDSDSKISKDPELAKKVSESKTGIIKGEVLKSKNIKIDSDFQIRKNKEHYDSILAKITQNEDLKNILLKTKDAKLMYYIPKEEPIVADNLMLVREKLS